METQIRKIGNSSGVILPSVLLRKLQLENGDSISITDENDKIILTSVKTKPKYSLSELMKQCDISSPLSVQEAEWTGLEPTGLEA